MKLTNRLFVFIPATLVFVNAGAYTTTYASIGFNGFAPLREHYV